MLASNKLFCFTQVWTGNLFLLQILHSSKILHGSFSSLGFLYSSFSVEIIFIGKLDSMKIIVLDVLRSTTLWQLSNISKISFFSILSVHWMVSLLQMLTISWRNQSIRCRELLCPFYLSSWIRLSCNRPSSCIQGQWISSIHLSFIPGTVVFTFNG